MKSEKTLAIIVFPNQNEVSYSELEKIRRTVKKEHPEYRLRMYANESAYKCKDEQGNIDCPKEDRQLVLTTSDVNGECGASVDYRNSTISVSFQGIAL